MILRQVRHQALALLFGTVTLLVGGGIAARHVSRAIDQLIVTTAQARQQSEAAQSILAAALDAETGQRGYLLTGRREYLQPYQSGTAQIDFRLDRLQRLARGTPWLEHEVGRLAATTLAKAAELQQTLAAAQREGPAAALAIVNTDAGRVHMDELRAVVERVSARADSERASRATKLMESQHTLTVLLLLSIGGVVVLLAAAAFVLLWNRSRLLQAQAATQQETARLQAAVEHVPDGVAVFDAGRRLTLGNDRFAPLLGVDAALGRQGTPLAELAGAALLGPILMDGPAPDAAVSGEVRQGERTLQLWRSPMPDGGQMLVVTDLSRRVAAEEAARQSQKMDVLGQMTGGVAHDFNNLLQVVSANLELLRSRLEQMPAPDPALLARLDAASAGVERGAKLTRQLLAFARRQPLAPESIDTARQLRGMEEMLRRTMGESVALELVIGGGVWPMRADPTQFENAILNLALNARDAMTLDPLEGQGIPRGKLTIEVTNAALDQAYAARVGEVNPGQYIMFAVSDSGLGMTAEQRSRATEPFYTTKAAGRGTGLGLPMVLGFAKQSGGHFQLYSEPGQGTTARIYIPRSTVAPAQPEPPSRPVTGSTGELVLLVEDDPDVRRVAHDALLSLDHQVVVADSADAGLALIEAGCRPRLIFSDVVMPGRLSAREMAARAAVIVPGIRVLFTSGYTQNSIVHNGQLDAGVTLISKPWRQKDLARAIRTVLEKPAPGGAEQRKRRVVVVSDATLVRSTAADALAGMGFEVVEAASGGAALGHLVLAGDGTHPAAAGPDLLITDGALPDQEGAALVEEVRRRRPGLPVILTSGQHEKPEGDFIWLAKPYDVVKLRLAVMEALAETGWTP